MHRSIGRHIRQSLMVLLLLFAAGTGALRAEEPKMQREPLLDRIWPFQMQFQPRINPLSEQDQDYAEAALIQWLEAYLDPAYKVIDKRFFWAHRKYQAWVPVSKAHALYPENANGRWGIVEEIEQPWQTPGSGLVRLWKVNIDGEDHYFAIAMTHKPVPGTRGCRLIGRFELIEPAPMFLNLNVRISSGLSRIPVQIG
jgi:hypothetical protein